MILPMVRPVTGTSKWDVGILVFIRTTVTTLFVAMLDFIWFRDVPFAFNLT